MKYKNKNYTVFETDGKSFEGIGKDIINFLKSSKPDIDAEDLIKNLAQEYEIDENTLRKDVAEFLDDCIRGGVLINIEQIREEENVIAEVHNLQKEISGLNVSNFGFCAHLGKELTPGCQSCQKAKWAVFFVCPKCNLDCFCCPYSAEKKRDCINRAYDCENCQAIMLAGTTFFDFQNLKFQFDLLKDQFNAIAWIGGEPMQPHVMKKILPLMKYFKETYPGYHQWIYTNGTFATKENMQKLFDAGISEIRFNLAATKFSSTTILSMKEAKKIFPYVCMEIAMTKESYEGLMKNITAILETGLDQMNLAEYIVGKNHLVDGGKLKEEGKLYTYRGFITSPIASRQYIYMVMKKAAAEKWPVVINDCSNEYKFYKLAIQANKKMNLFKSKQNYWGNTYSLSEIDQWNDGLN